MKRYGSLLLLALAGCVLPPDRIAELHADDTKPGSETDGSTPEPETETESEAETDDDSTTDVPAFDLPPDLPPEPTPTCEGDCPCESGLCVQSCPANFQYFCDMECPRGAMCEQTCETDFCSSDCFESSSCHEQCLVGGCSMDCHGSDDCSIECLGMAPCAMTCQASLNCRIGCPLGNCSMVCLFSTCVIDQCPGGCTIFCGPGSDCSCADPATCNIVNI